MSFAVTYQGSAFNPEERRIDITLTDDNNMASGVVIAALPTMQGEIQRVAPLSQARVAEIINAGTHGVTPANFRNVILDLIREGIRDAYDDSRTGWAP